MKDISPLTGQITLKIVSIEKISPRKIITSFEKKQPHPKNKALVITINYRLHLLITNGVIDFWFDEFSNSYHGYNHCEMPKEYADIVLSETLKALGFNSSMLAVKT